MELRMLIAETDRDRFGRLLREVRAMRGSGFAETPRSLTGELHLKFGNLYGLFDESKPSSPMLGGFAMHDLGMFGQSFPRPDLSHLPPDKVFECGELWAAAAGAAPILRHAGFILAGHLRAEALLLYPIFKPWNLSSAYNRGFQRMGDPVAWPYARTLSGGQILVQPMVSEGEALTHLIAEANIYSSEILEDGHRIRFNTPHSICPKTFYDRALRPNRAAVINDAPNRVAA